VHLLAARRGAESLAVDPPGARKKMKYPKSTGKCSLKQSCGVQMSRRRTVLSRNERLELRELPLLMLFLYPKYHCQWKIKVKPAGRYRRSMTSPRQRNPIWSGKKLTFNKLQFSQFRSLQWQGAIMNHSRSLSTIMKERDGM
jgi:hypothetical protein